MLSEGILNSREIKRRRSEETHFSDGALHLKSSRVDVHQQLSCSPTSSHGEEEFRLWCGRVRSSVAVSEETCDSIPVSLLPQLADVLGWPETHPHRYVTLLFLLSSGSVRNLLSRKEILLSRYSEVLREMQCCSLDQAVHRTMQHVGCSFSNMIEHTTPSHTAAANPRSLASITGSPLRSGCSHSFPRVEGASLPFVDDFAPIPLAQLFHAFTFELAAATLALSRDSTFAHSHYSRVSPPVSACNLGWGYTTPNLRWIPASLAIPALRSSVGEFSPLVAPLCTFLSCVVCGDATVSHDIHKRCGSDDEILQNRLSETAVVVPPQRGSSMREQSITRDQWSMIFCFCRSMSLTKLTNYNADDSWPCLIDEFVAWYAAQQR